MIPQAPSVVLFLVVVTMLMFSACADVMDSPKPDPSGAETPVPTRPANNGATPQATAASPLTEPPSRELELVILFLTPSAKPGDEIFLRILTAPTATATVEVKYPQSEQPVPLEPRKVGPDGEASWTWRVPASSPAGEAEVTVSASVIGRTLKVAGKFTVEEPG